MKTKLIKIKLFYFIKKVMPILIFLIFEQIHAQDIIVRNTGDTIFCKITNIDSTKIMFDMEKNEKIISTSISKNEIIDYKYQYQYTSSIEYQIDTIKSLDIVLIYKKNGNPYKILKNEKDVSLYDLDQMLKNDKEAYSIYKKAGLQRLIALCFAGSGGACIGSALAQLMLGEIDGPTAGGIIGAGCVFVAIAFPIQLKANINFFNAVKKYDANLKNTSMRPSNRGLYFGLCNNGVGFNYKF